MSNFADQQIELQTARFNNARRPLFHSSSYFWRNSFLNVEFLVIKKVASMPLNENAGFSISSSVDAIKNDRMPSRPILSIKKSSECDIAPKAVDMQTYLTQFSVTAKHFGLSVGSFTQKIPGNSISVLLQSYCDEICKMAPGFGQNRRRTGPRELTYRLIGEIYEIGYYLPKSSKDRHFLKILKVGHQILLDKNGKVEFLDTKKMSAWALACQTLYDQNIEPDGFFEALVAANGLERLRRSRNLPREANSS